MDFTVHYKPNPLTISSNFFYSSTSPNLLLFKPHLKQRIKHSHKKLIFRASSSSGNENDSDRLSWSKFYQSLRRGSERFFVNFSEMVKKETGFDLERPIEKIRDVGKKGGAAFDRLRFELVPEFIDWNKWENWKVFKNWEPKRIAALILYAFVVAISCQKIYMVVRAPGLDRSKGELTEAYMEAVIPEPSPSNIRRFKRSIWRKTMPKGLKMKKFIEGPDGTLVHDSSYVGEDAWDDDPEPSQGNINQIIDSDKRLNPEEKKDLKDLGISGGDPESTATWRERLQTWTEILKKEKLAEQVDSLKAKYAVEFDMQEVEKSFRKDVMEKVSDTQGSRVLWISKRWWRYRPSLPYTYFLQKLDCSEVAAVVFTEDLRKLYVTMKEGFPLEYVVNIPLDPHLFEIISSSGVEVDLLQKRQLEYIFRIVLTLLPGILILGLMGITLRLLRKTTKRLLRKKYGQLFAMTHDENFILPVGDAGGSRSMYKEVVLGGDVWDLLDELMLYMQNPMQYFEKEVRFVRGVLLSGPPGTGKTLFARTLAKESGLPFVFASGAEFTDNEKSGAARINKLFSIARRNAPAFVFVDEIDAIAGRHAKRDPQRKATFEALIAQLDGDKDSTGVDRYSLKQAVIFICATNRPDELHEEFYRPGCIDRHLYVGLPDAKQRVQIFGVHSAGKPLAEDVDFEKLVFRTVGYSGADIRNLVNEAGIMAVRKGHSKIDQQDIVDVLDKLLLEGMGVLLTEEEQQKCEKNVSPEKKRLLAVHEAGHILLAHLFPRPDWHAFSQLLPGGKETALSVFYPREDMVDQGYTTFGYMKMQMIVAHGGRCAERIVFGDDITDGGTDDLEKITKIAREMVISPSNSKLGFAKLIDGVGAFNTPDSPEGEIIKYTWDDPHVVPANMTLEVSELFTRELTRYIEETEELAMNGLKQNKHILDMIVNELLEKSRITGLEVADKMKGMSPVMFEDFIRHYQINPDEEGPLPRNEKLSYQPLEVYTAPLHRC